MHSSFMPCCCLDFLRECRSHMPFARGSILPLLPCSPPVTLYHYSLFPAFGATEAASPCLYYLLRYKNSSPQKKHSSSCCSLLFPALRVRGAAAGASSRLKYALCTIRCAESALCRTIKCHYSLLGYSCFGRSPLNVATYMRRMGGMLADCLTVGVPACRRALLRRARGIRQNLCWRRWRGGTAAAIFYISCFFTPSGGIIKAPCAENKGGLPVALVALSSRHASLPPSSPPVSAL